MPIGGIFLAIKSDNPILSFLGFMLVVVPFGFILGPIVDQYSPDVVRNVLGITATITVIMGIAGTVFPSFFSKIGGFLFVSLCGLLITRLIQFFVPSWNLLRVDYIAAGIFSLYIGYDMYRANKMPKTYDNAVDICIDLFLDIINLFINLLRIFGNRN